MVIRHILQYLIDHPDAKDTLQGILQWWLPANMVGWEEEDVREALDELLAKGWITQRRLISSEMLYGLNKVKIEEIRSFLQDM